MMMKVVFLTIVFTIALISFGFSQEPTDVKVCPVSGTVTDLQGGLVPNVGVSFQGQSKSRTYSNMTGTYGIDLPAGLYEVTLTPGVNQGQFKRSRVFIDCKSKEIVNLILLPQCVSFGCDQGGFSFDHLARDLAAKRDIRAVIAYARRTKRDQHVSYEKVVMTYNRITISADRLDYDTVEKTFFFSGSVSYDDGVHQVRYDRLRGVLNIEEFAFRVLEG